MSYFPKTQIFFDSPWINPISYGQPKLWINAADTGFLKNSSNVTPSAGDLLNIFNRYTDNSFNPTNVNTINRATYNIIASQPHSYGYISWLGSLSGAGSHGQYQVGTTSDFSFLHQLNSKFTIYHVFKNDPNENIAASKFLASTTQSTGNRGFINYIANNVNDRTINFDIRNDTGSQNAVTYASNYSYTKTTDVPIMLWSFRCDLSVGVGNNSMWGYRNGILDKVVTMSNAPSSTAASFTTLRIGNRALGDGRYEGYLGEYIIFNGIHTEGQHNMICNYLKKKWNIT